MRKHIWRAYFSYFLIAISYGPSLAAQPAIGKELSPAAFIEIVKQYHPVGKQSALLPQQARAELRIARGGFDPLLYSDFSRKNYEGTSYYSYFENQVKIPVWYGIELKAGYDLASGYNINPDKKVPDVGLGYVGLSLPLGANLVLDKKRAALKQARLFTTLSEQQRIAMLNDLLLAALKAYYDWSLAYQQYSIYDSAISLAVTRFEGVKNLARLGDRASIDTIEALTQLQSRLLLRNDARLRFLNTGLELSNFLWLEDESPAPFDTTIIPTRLDTAYVNATLNLAAMDEIAGTLRSTHPELMQYSLKLKQLDIDRRLKIENLKPLINVNYSVLSKQFHFNSDAGLILANNYKVGVNFAMPVAFTQGRGDLKLAKLKIEQAQYALDLKAKELTTKLKSSFNELATLQQQTSLSLALRQSYEALLLGEQQRFKNGESTMFLINQREMSYIESQIKLAEIIAKYHKGEASYKWAAGNMGR